MQPVRWYQVALIPDSKDKILLENAVIITNPSFEHREELAMLAV